MTITVEMALVFVFAISTYLPELASSTYDGGPRISAFTDKKTGLETRNSTENLREL